jgi:hypothetical protein
MRVVDDRRTADRTMRVLDDREAADAFWRDLHGVPPRPARRARAAGEPRPFAPPDEQAPAQAPQTCGFFGAHNIVRTEALVRAAIVASANAEWSAWHTAGRPRFETDAGMFGRLVGHCAAANGSLKPDTLLAIQFAAVGTINYAPLLAATTANAAATAAAALAPALTARAPAEPGLGAIAQRIALQARDARRDSLPWSAAFVVVCVRGAGMTLGLETIVGVDRRHVVPAPLLLPSFRHADYTREARQRRANRRRGTYHAFTPAERAPQRGDIIVVDRQATTMNGVVTLAGLGSLEAHGDIVIDVDRQRRHVEAVGGNLSDGSDNPIVGEESVRKRRYPIDARGFLVRAAAQRFTQEDNTGTVPALPDPTTDALHSRSTARIFALLSPIEDCRAPAGRT